MIKFLFDRLKCCSYGVVAFHVCLDGEDTTFCTRILLFDSFSRFLSVRQRTPRQDDLVFLRCSTKGSDHLIAQASVGTRDENNLAAHVHAS